MCFAIPTSCAHVKQEGFRNKVKNNLTHRQKLRTNSTTTGKQNETESTKSGIESVYSHQYAQVQEYTTQIIIIITRWKNRFLLFCAAVLGTSSIHSLNSCNCRASSLLAQYLYMELLKGHSEQFLGRNTSHFIVLRSTEWNVQFASIPCIFFLYFDDCCGISFRVLVVYKNSSHPVELLGQVHSLR